MPNFYEYNPEQAYLLPPSVREVLGEAHLCFFVHRAVEKLNLESFVGAYSEEGPVRGGWRIAFGRIWRCGIWRAGRGRIIGR